jgi:hypothetical protein
MYLHNYIQNIYDVDNEKLDHQLDHHGHHGQQLVKYHNGILYKENEVDDMKKEEENKHMYNKRNVQLDALIIQTRDQDYDFYDEDYENDDTKMHQYRLGIIHIE